MALRAYLYIGNLVEFGGKNLDDLTGVCQHASDVSLLQKLLVGNAPRILPSLLFERGSCILADRAGSFARVLALLDRLADRLANGESAERDDFLATASRIRDFLRSLPRSSHVLLEPGELFADFEPDAQTHTLVADIEETCDRVSRAIRGGDDVFLDEIRREWRRHIDSFWSEHLYFSFTADRVRLVEEAPRGAWITPGRGERCAECYGAIDSLAIHDATRVGIVRPEVRVTHLACVLWTAREAVRLALGDVRDGAVVEPWVERCLDMDLAPYASIDPALLDDPQNITLLAKFAAERTDAGDPYAEVIATDVALAATPTRELHARQRQLHEQFAPGRYSWGVGFLRSATVYRHLTALRAPYNALVTELHPSVSFWSDEEFEQLAAWAPRSIRRLVVRNDRAEPRAGVARLVAALPRLSDLAFAQSAAFERIAHPRLRRLSIGTNDHASAENERGQDRLADVLRALAPADLPSVVELAVRPRRRADTAAICTALVEGGWLAQLERLVMSNIDASMLAQLVPALAHRRITIELHDAPIASALLHELRNLADVVAPEVVTPSFVVGASIQHTGKPEWGTGRVTSVRDGKLEIAFGKTKRTFKADAVFLRVVEAP